MQTVEGLLTADHVLATRQEGSGSPASEPATVGGLAFEKRSGGKRNQKPDTTKLKSKGVMLPCPHCAEGQSPRTLSAFTYDTLSSPPGQLSLHGLSYFPGTLMTLHIFFVYNHVLTNPKWTHLSCFTFCSKIRRQAS